MNRKIKQILLTLSSIMWMIRIFGFSSDTAEESSRLSAMVCTFLAENFIRGFDAMSPSDRESIIDGMQIYVRKGAHVTEYIILGVLLVLTFAAYRLRKAGTTALAAGILYAALDEYHQSFVPGRSGEIKDVLIDACGLLLGLLAVREAGRFIQMIKEKKKADGGSRSPHMRKEGKNL